MPSPLSPFVSQKFRFWAFVSMVLLVFVHGYNLENRYLQPWTLPHEPLTFTSFTEYFLANGLFRFRIPMLFIISGFLYALHDAKPNKERVGKRARTLLLPYVIWSAIGIGLTYVLEYFPFTRSLVERSHIMQIDETRLLIHDYHWYELLARWLLSPVSYQLWFIRVLFVYNAAYPLIRSWVLHPHGRWIFFFIAFLLWVTTSAFVFIEGEGLLFFSLGVWIQKTGFEIETKNANINALRWGVAFVVAAAVKTVLAYEGQAWMGGAVFPVITLLHKFTVVSGLIACWYGLDGLVRRCMNQKWFVWFSSFSFIIYALHVPIVAIFIDGMFDWLKPMPGYRLITFVALPLMIVGMCILVGWLLRVFTPKVYSTLTGGRGF